MSLDLVGCAAEPIRVPGAIQPHGWLVAFDRLSAKVVAYSTNCTELTGLASGDGLTAALRELVAPLISTSAPGQTSCRIGTVLAGGRSLDVSSHCSGSLELLEFEPVTAPDGARAPLHLSRAFIDAVRKVATVQELVSLVATEMKRITGYGRCLIYSFDREGHGSVLAEDRDAGYDSYLGHSFPASDIPSQARDLYLANHIRVIPDARYAPVAIHFAETGWKAARFDLSFAHLRSVSPVHLEYMRNMRTSASMSVSIVVDGCLWGLISCHDNSPHPLSLDARELCEHLGQFLSLLIEAREENDDIGIRHAQRGLTMEIISHLSQSDSTLGSLVGKPELLLGLTGASGAAVVFDDQCWTVGLTPSREQVIALAAWASAFGEVHHSDHLAGTDAPPFSHAAGLLAIRLSSEPRHLVIWFRPEVLRSVRWAGEPPKIADESGRLHPRRSFGTWEEVVRGHCAPWTSSEIAGATELGSALLDIVLHRVRERADAEHRLDRLTMEKEAAESADSAKTRFLAVLSHELRTPLASIGAAAEALSRNAAVTDRYSNLVAMIQRSVAIEVRLVDDLLDMSAISAGKLHLGFESVDMNEMVAQVAELLTAQVAAKAQRLVVVPAADAPRIQADPVRIQQVLLNLLRNAVKFTPRGGLIEVRSIVEEDTYVLACKDTGIGIDAGTLATIFNAFEQGSSDTHKRYGGLGLGLSIAVAIVQGHGGTLTAESEGRDLGATFTLRLPQRAS